MNRRDFLTTSTLAVSAAATASFAAAAPGSTDTLRKGVCLGVLSAGKTVAEKFDMARQAGFEGVEPNTLYSAEEVQQYKEAAARSGIKIHSIMNSDHWKFPLTDNDPDVVKKCMEGIRTSMRNAHELGADAILLVPGIVTADVGYGEVYRRSQERIRELLPMASTRCPSLSTKSSNLAPDPGPCTPGSIRCSVRANAVVSQAVSGSP